MTPYSAFSNNHLILFTLLMLSASFRLSFTCMEKAQLGSHWLSQFLKPFPSQTLTWIARKAQEKLLPTPWKKKKKLVFNHLLFSQSVQAILCLKLKVNTPLKCQHINKGWLCVRKKSPIIIITARDAGGDFFLSSL